MKKWFLFVLLLALGLAACSAGAPTAPGKQPVGASTAEPFAATVEPAALPTEAAATAPVGTQTVSGSAAANAPAGCTVVSPQPTPGPTEQSLFPPVGEEDWVFGPEEASITILEYSDFQ